MIPLVITVILGLSIIIAAVLSSMILSKGFNTAYEKIHKENASLNCLCELVDTLNETFPGSNLCVEETNSDVKVRGELKYLKK